jgi:hypothetical protein
VAQSARVPVLTHAEALKRGLVGQTTQSEDGAGKRRKTRILRSITTERKTKELREASSSQALLALLRVNAVGDFSRADAER